MLVRPRRFRLSNPCWGMADRVSPAVYTIPAHRAFSDALAAGILARHGKDMLALARGMVLLPNNRAVRAVSAAFVRRSQGGLLMPRLVPIGDEALDERLGNALDPIGEEAAVPPAVAPMERQMILARLVQQARAEIGQPVNAGEAMRLGQALGAVVDQLFVEQIDPRRLHEIDMEDALSGHWQSSLRLLGLLLDRWPEELACLGMIDLTDRRNRLLSHLAKRWRNAPPRGFVVAAGISTTAPAVCAVLRTVAHMEQGQVVLAALDQHMNAQEWDAIGPFKADPATGHRLPAQESHPQYAVKCMLDRIGVSRDEVMLWRWGGGHDAHANRSRNISNAMLVPAHTGKWRMLKAGERTFNGVRLMEAANPAQEAQAIALMLREVVETPGRTAALITPDRTLAARVSAHLGRWGITADDSAGRPLSLTPPGTLLLALARVAAERFAPVPLLDLLKHPLVRKGDARLDWLENVRGLDLLLRGPRPAPGLEGLAAHLAPAPDGYNDRQARLRAQVAAWWQEAVAPLAPLRKFGEGVRDLPAIFAMLREVAGVLSGDYVWAGHQGRALADLFADMERAAPLGPHHIEVRSLSDFLMRLLEQVAVRPPQGGHPRIAIYGLLEARLQQADLMVLAGLNEGTWPGLPAPDPWLAPRIRRELGLPGVEQRIGLAAHDFASALGAPEVIVTRSRRSGTAPAVASRFWLRLQAIAGENLSRADQYGAWAAAIDRPEAHTPAPRPRLCPPLSLRPTRVAVTQVDRLSADPYAFYASRILRLSSLEQVDAEPGAPWRGIHAHRILELWYREDGGAIDALEARARAHFAGAQTHPVLRALWLPRLLASLRWVGQQVVADRADGRHVALVETTGELDLGGVTLTGTADRIDHLRGGGIAIVDYKTGKPPSAAQVKAGFALQLGLLGAMAEQGGMAELGGEHTPTLFEYWSLAKGRSDDFGYRYHPVKPGGSDRLVATEDFTSHATACFLAASEKWLTGEEPFVARLNPNLPSHDDYDQLMRLEEWYGRGEADG